MKKNVYCLLFICFVISCDNKIDNYDIDIGFNSQTKLTFFKSDLNKIIIYNKSVLPSDDNKDNFIYYERELSTLESDTIKTLINNIIEKLNDSITYIKNGKDSTCEDCVCFCIILNKNNKKYTIYNFSSYTTVKYNTENLLDYLFMLFNKLHNFNYKECFKSNVKGVGYLPIPPKPPTNKYILNSK